MAPRPKLRWFKGPLVSLAVLLLAALALEAGLALLDVAQVDAVEPFRGSGPMQVQSVKKRFDEAACLAPKPADAYRILGVGDSFTYGWGVRSDESYLSLVGRELAGRHPGRRIEVLNWGIPGWNTVQEVDWLEQRGLACDPDLVVIGFYLNDVNELRPWTRIFRRIARELMSENEGSWWYHHSRLYRFVKGRLDHRRVKRHVLDCYVEDFFGSTQEWSRWEECEAALARARGLSLEHDFELLVMVIPVLIDLGRDYPLIEITDLVCGACRRLSIPVLDLLPWLRGERAENLWVSAGDQHANARGHRIMARALASEIERLALVGPPAAGPGLPGRPLLVADAGSSRPPAGTPADRRDSERRPLATAAAAPERGPEPAPPAPPASAGHELVRPPANEPARLEPAAAGPPEEFAPEPSQEDRGFEAADPDRPRSWSPPWRLARSLRLRPAGDDDPTGAPPLGPDLILDLFQWLCDLALAPDHPGHLDPDTGPGPLEPADPAPAEPAVDPVPGGPPEGEPDTVEDDRPDSDPADPVIAPPAVPTGPTEGWSLESRPRPAVLDLLELLLAPPGPGSAAADL